jgi:hypothetical protein
MPNGKLSREEDKIVRDWLKEEHDLQLSQFRLYRLTPAEVVKLLRKEDPEKFKSLTIADIERAARR